MQAFQLGNEWILVKNLRRESSQGITGSSSGSARTWMAYDGCWTGVRWAPQNSFALKFTSKEDADIYLSENADIMEQSA